MDFIQRVSAPKPFPTMENEENVLAQVQARRSFSGNICGKKNFLRYSFGSGTSFRNMIHRMFFVSGLRPPCFCTEAFSDNGK
jgi:hypothetical protein